MGTSGAIGYAEIEVNTWANTTDDGTHYAEDVLVGHGLASAILTLSWSDDRALHEEQSYIEKFSVWREADLLPPDIGLKIPGMGGKPED